jgi:hypothetical protein
MESSWSDLVVSYLFVGVLVVGLPLIFFVVAFMPGLMRTTGEHIGASEIQPRDSTSRKPVESVCLTHPSSASVPVQDVPRPRAISTFANTA